MELQKFVQKTIEEILGGVEEAKNNLGSEVIDPMRTGGRRFVQNLEFDVAVTVEEKNASGVDGKIKVFGYGIGGNLTSDTVSSTVTRIKFVVPVTYSGKKNANN